MCLKHALAFLNSFPAPLNKLVTIIGERVALVHKTTENWLDLMSVTAVVATLLEAALYTGLMVREEATDTNGCRSQDLHEHEQQSCSR